MGGPKQAGWDHFVQQKMVLGPNQAAIFGPAGPKFDPDQKIRDRTLPKARSLVNLS